MRHPIPLMNAALCLLFGLVFSPEAEGQARSATPPGNVISGRVTGTVHPLRASDPLEERAFRDLYVNGAITDPLGFYSFPCAGLPPFTVSAALSGPFCRVVRMDGTSPSFHQDVDSCPATVDVAWDDSDSDVAERDAFYHVNAAHAHLKALDPSYTGNDLPLTVGVNETSDDCVALLDGETLVFSRAGPGCPNLATIPDIVYREYGRFANDRLYFWRGSFLGLSNPALGQGLADAFAAFMTDDPVIGEGVYGPGTFLRNLDNTLRWPEDKDAGLILGAALWDLRESVGLETADHLAHFAKYGTPDDPDDGLAMSKYFVALLVADDDDDDLSNGTPHFDAIADAFNAHGIGTGMFLDIVHTPLSDPSSSGPFPVAATFQYTGPIGALDATSPTLFYSVDALPFIAEPMSPTGNPNEWAAEIPQLAGAIVKYYLRVSDTYGGQRTEPIAAAKPHVFVAGPASAVFMADLETDPGWVVGAEGDNATSGIWLLDDPIGTQAQPADDHTPPPGFRCYVTGNADSTLFPGVNDVDGGKTTLVTAVFDAVSGGIASPIVSYYRWYSNDTGDAPGTDVWQADISNDGGASWVPVEYTTESDPSWRRTVFFIEDLLTPTTHMMMRFIAADENDASLVEAAVDDFSLLAFPAPVTVGDPLVPRGISLGPAAPNPFTSSTLLHYTLPVAAHVRLAVFDIHGRLVRSLVNADQDEGPYAVAWEGKDEAGRTVRSGLYFVRLTQEGRSATRAVVRVR